MKHPCAVGWPFEGQCFPTACADFWVEDTGCIAEMCVGGKQTEMGYSPRTVTALQTGTPTGTDKAKESC